MNFIINEVPDRFGKNLSFIHFILDSFTNKAQFDAGFSQRMKLKNNAVPTVLDPTVMLHHTSVSNCFYYMVYTLLLQIVDMY